MSANVCDYARDMQGVAFEIGKFDCLQMVIKFLGRFSKVPKKYEGFTTNTYFLLYRKNPARAIELMVEYLESFLDEIDWHDMRSGDIAVLSYNFSPYFLGIVMGNGKVLVVDQKHGIVSVFLGFYKIERVFRCREQSQLPQPSE